MIKYFFPFRREAEVSRRRRKVAVNIVQPLLHLQEIDRRIRELEQEAVDIPDRKAKESASIFAAQEELDAAKAKLREAQARAAASEAEIKAMDERLQQMKDEQSKLESKSEYATFNLEIQRLAKDRETQESRQLLAMDDMVPLKTRVAEAEAKVQKEKAAIDDYISELDARLASVKEQLTACEAERREYLGQVPDSLLMRYERIKTRRWPVVVELNSDGACTGCHLVQPPSIAQDTRRNNQVVTCLTCGRVLYSE